MDKTSIIIADDHPIFRIGLNHILKKSGDFTVIAEAEDSDQLFEILRNRSCSIVLLDIKMPGRHDGLSALKIIKEKFPKIKVLIISEYCNKYIVDEAMGLGVDGYITKNDISKMLLIFLKTILKGGKAFSPRIQFLFMDDHGVLDEKLTNREKEVLSLSVKGLIRKQIAERLNITISTVNFHRHNIKGKLHADNFAEMIRIAYEKGLV